MSCHIGTQIPFYCPSKQNLFTDNIHEAYRIGKVGECLREESPNKHRIKSRLGWEWETNLKMLVEPAQAVSSTFPSLYESAMLVVSYYLLYIPISWCSTCYSSHFTRATACTLTALTVARCYSTFLTTIVGNI